MAKSNYEFIATRGTPLKAWTRGVPVQDKARQQLERMASLPFIHKHIAVMPDVHWGLGATVGSVIPCKGAIVPAAVGVDIGCGMAAVRTDLTSHRLPQSLAAFRAALEAAVPHGRTGHTPANDKGSWTDPPDDVGQLWRKPGGDGRSLALGHAELVQRHPGLGKANAVHHLGTLGTGNHFVEICLDEADRVWAMLHSGSRGIGNRIGTSFVEKAKREAERWFIPLPDPDLAYLPEGTPAFDDYVRAVAWAQDFAAANRAAMMARTLRIMREVFGPFGVEAQAVNCHHNYVARETHFGEAVWVTRKGAVRAGKGDLGIVPGSMGGKSFIVRGKGNPESFHSCSHGAGRVLGREEAKRRFTVGDHMAATAGIECRKDADVIDETPMAYKDIDAVMAAQSDLVEIVHTLKQVVCVKG